MSHCDRILHALRDGQWHTTADLYRTVGPCILHSRISDLRKKGHTVEGRHVPGKTGADGYEYRLITEAKRVRPPVDHDASPEVVPAAEQLTAIANAGLTRAEMDAAARGFAQLALHVAPQHYDH